MLETGSSITTILSFTCPSSAWLPIEKGQAGYLTSKNVRYGYVLSDDHKELVIDDDAAKVVEGIFRDFLNGKGYKQIADRLNADGIDSPHEYLARKLGRKTDPRTHGKWNLRVIGRIITNPIYMGKAERSIQWNVTTLTVPAIVSEEDFRKAQELAAQNSGNRMKRKTIPANVLNGYIFDKETGKKLICLKSDGGSVYVTDRNYRYLRKDDRFIPEATVLTAVKEALREEAEQAKKIDAILRSADTDVLFETVTEPYRIEGRELLNRMNEIYEKRMAAQDDEQNSESSAEYWAELERCEQRFQEIMSSVDKARLALSLKNPWLLLFRDAEVPEILTRKDVKRWIATVTVEDYQKVTVTFQKQEWKELLPQECLPQEDNMEG